MKLVSVSPRTQARTIAQGSGMYAPVGFIEAGLERPALPRQLEPLEGTGYRA